MNMINQKHIVAGILSISMLFTYTTETVLAGSCRETVILGLCSDGEGSDCPVSTHKVCWGFVDSVECENTSASLQTSTKISTACGNSEYDWSCCNDSTIPNDCKQLTNYVCTTMSDTSCTVGAQLEIIFGGSPVGIAPSGNAGASQNVNRCKQTQDGQPSWTGTHQVGLPCT